MNNQTKPATQTLSAGDCLAQLISRGVTVAAIAADAGVTRQTLHYWRTGKRRPEGRKLTRLNHVTRRFIKYHNELDVAPSSWKLPAFQRAYRSIPLAAA